MILKKLYYSKKYCFILFKILNVNFFKDFNFKI